MLIVAVSYLAIGLVLAASLTGTLVSRYDARVRRPAARMHGPGQVAIAEDLLIFVGIGLIVVVAWLPLSCAYAYIKGARLFGRGRSRENNPTPTL